MKKGDPARIFDRIEKTDTGCWLYTGGISSSGYGIVSVRNKSVHTHRLAYQLRCGSIPEGMCVLHRCDVRRCINPEHLFLGSLADNNRDCMRKGRTADRRGEKNTQVKYPDAEIARLLEMHATGKYSQRQLAGIFHMSQQHISGIVRGAFRNGKRRYGRE